MMQPCEIALLGAPVLRRPADVVNHVKSLDTIEIIKQMEATLVGTQGVGLAAPQIGISKRIIIVASRPTARYPNAPFMQPTVMVNPAYQPLSDEKNKDWEGCLSVPGIRALVPRYQIITVNYVNEIDEFISQTLEGFVARVFQHEYDHLEGMVYLDRVESSLDIVAESEYLKLYS